MSNHNFQITLHRQKEIKRAIHECRIFPVELINIMVHYCAVFECQDAVIQDKENLIQRMYALRVYLVPHVTNELSTIQSLLFKKFGSQCVCGPMSEVSYYRPLRYVEDRINSNMSYLPTLDTINSESFFHLIMLDHHGKHTQEAEEYISHAYGLITQAYNYFVKDFKRYP